jgi:hypothetical protein
MLNIHHLLTYLDNNPHSQTHQNVNHHNRDDQKV